VIRINLLQSRLSEVKRTRVIPVKPILSLLLLAAVMTGGFLLYQTLSVEKSAPVEHRKTTAAFKSEETPFDVVEDIVDDIHGGRFKVKTLNRLSSPAHLSPNEKKMYERLFIKAAFDAFNTTIQTGMGFNTITLDNEGNFFVYGVAQDVEAGNTFREALEKQDCILKVDELSFKKGWGESKTHFAMKGFLNYNILERFYESDAVSKVEEIKESAENVLFEMRKSGDALGIRWVKPAEWGESEPFGVAKKHTVRIQAEATYSGLMKWITAMYERNLQIGFSRMNLTSIGQGKVLSALECYVYAKN
jgi:hypothetical protein